MVLKGYDYLHALNWYQNGLRGYFPTFHPGFYYNRIQLKEIVDQITYMGDS